MGMSAGGFTLVSVATVIVATDGSGDFTNIQTAIDSLPSGGGVVYIKEGTYTITTGLTITVDKVSIFGAGAATLITSTSVLDFITITDADDVTISDLAIKGTTGAITQRGISSNSNGTIISNIRIEQIRSIE